MNRDKLHSMRENYEHDELLEHEIQKNPHHQFSKWMKQAVEDKLFEPNAFSLSTVDENGQPSCRTVLLKDILDNQFVFYTNYESKKGQQLAGNNKAAILFWWREHERQVRIEGVVKKVAFKISDDYYKKRPIGSQIGAKASPQSKIVNGRDELNKLYSEAELKYNSGDNDCPTFWGGYALEANLFEFWQGRPNRLHDRIQYTLENGEWKIVRLAP